MSPRHSEECLQKPFSGFARTAEHHDTLPPYGQLLVVEDTMRHILVLEELEIRDLDEVTRVYAELLGCHIRMLKLLLPRVMWKDVPVIVVFE
ncbi:hypothetical protein CRENBAI_010607 [Crenichthys baileyi]|uniref:Uncharacterized protein n=1 Tax=Crenichthys baileyi TaxID=28760 RepID=A0AAV9QW86_9TELE